MSSSTVYDAFKAKLVADLGGTYAIRDWEEVEVALTGGVDPWIAMEDTGGTDTLTSIGTPSQNWVEDEGFLDIHVFTPSTGGLGPCRAIADTIRDTFRYFHFTGLPAGETLRIDAVNPPEPGTLHDGLWHTMIVTVEYTNRYAVATAAE